MRAAFDSKAHWVETYILKLIEAYEADKLFLRPHGDDVFSLVV